MVAAVPSAHPGSVAPGSSLAPSEWVRDFLGAVEASPDGAPPPLLPPEVVVHARRALSEAPFPSRREEAWRFTDASMLTTIAPVQLRSSLSTPTPEPGGSALRLVLDGCRDPLAGRSLPAGLERVTSDWSQTRLGQICARNACHDHWPVLLNASASPRVLALRVTGPVAPVMELISDTGQGSGVLPLRVLLILEEGASLEVLQVIRSSGASLTNLVVEVQLSRQARLHHGLLALGDSAGAFLGHVAVTQAPDSEISHTCLSRGWGLARVEPRIHQEAGAALTRLRGLQVVDGRQIADTHTRVVFGGPDGTLDQLHKAVADGEARSVFNGAVCVPRAAQRTSAEQMSRNLLLSRRARIDTKPELEIVADDVRCAHGATVSRLQQDELFYLQSRGIAADQASRLLLRGFCDEVLRELPGDVPAWGALQGWMLSQEPSR